MRGWRCVSQHARQPGQGNAGDATKGGEMNRSQQSPPLPGSHLTDDPSARHGATYNTTQVTHQAEKKIPVQKLPSSTFAADATQATTQGRELYSQHMSESEMLQLVYRK